MNNEETTVSMIEMTAGEMLRNARTTGRRKREIGTIAKLLCIREEFLTALEEGNYRVIPEDVYILGFARSYAVELGLDPDEVILKLKRELGLINEEKEEEKCQDPKRQMKKIDKETLLQWYKTSLEYVKKHWKWFAGGFGALIVLVVLSVLLFGHNTSDIDDAKINATENVGVASNTVKEPDFRYPVREKFEVKNSKESRVVIQAEKESWVKIEDARGSSLFSRVLVPGDVYYMPLSDKLKATFGNVGAIDVWVDGQLIKKLGPANTKKSGISMAPDALKSVGFAD